MLLVCLKVDFTYSQEGQCSVEHYLSSIFNRACMHPTVLPRRYGSSAALFSFLVWVDSLHAAVTSCDSQACGEFHVFMVLLNVRQNWIPSFWHTWISGGY